MRSWTHPLLVIAMAIGVAALPNLAPPSVEAQSTPTQLLPNLTPLQASDFRNETIAGRTYVRFTTTSWNNGAGALELRPGTVDTGAGKQKVFQRIYHRGSGWTDVEINAWFDYHAAHNHIHFNDYAEYRLISVNGNASDRVGSKVTFCIIDTTRMNTRLPGAPKKATYTTCAATRQGMSVGWGDQYRYHLEGQSLDTTGLPDGPYDFRITIDPKNLIIEQNDGDNVSTKRINLVAGRVQ